VSSRATPPFRADHVGSLLRPPELIRARAAFADGAIDADGLRDAEDTAIREVVALQEDIGLRSATDGEFRRTSWHMDFIYQQAAERRPGGKASGHGRVGFRRPWR
jgi:5-methyltetrahydropteroyltriglutamate--homocysteine methyltransferase